MYPSQTHLALSSPRRLVTLVSLAVLAVLLLLATGARAASFTVNSTSDAPLEEATSAVCKTAEGNCTLRAAVEAADNAGGDSTITLPAGHYVREAGNGELTVGDSANDVALTIDGAGQSTTVIEVSGEGRGFDVEAKGDSLQLSGVTITGGHETDGAAIYNYQGAVQLSEVTLSRNEASEYGGAIYNYAGSVQLSEVTLSRNEAGWDGGAIYGDEGSVKITGSTLSGNESEYEGGAIYNEGTLQVDGSTLERNKSRKEYGGAIYNYYSTAKITGSTLNSNEASEGGAVFAEYGNVTVAGSTLSDNHASEEGGALYDYYYSQMTVVDSTLTGNEAASEGGAIIGYEYGSVTVTGSTLAGNKAEYGAGIYSYWNGLNVTNSTLLGNEASGEGGAFYLEEAGGYEAVLLNSTIAGNKAVEFGGGIAYPKNASEVANTIVAGNSPEDCYEGPAGRADVGGNIDSDGSCFAQGGKGTTPEATGDQPAVNPLLAPLAANGGPTETMALQPGSPAIAHGLAAFCPESDQRGVPRPAGGCDVGAFQSNTADLAAAVSAPASATQGSTISYRIAVTNNGPNATGPITVSDALPAGVSLYFAGTAGGSCAGTSTVTCSLPSLEKGEGETATIVAVANNVGAITDTASVAGAGYDPNSSNNTASATTQVTAPPKPTLKPTAKTGRVSERTKHTVLVSGTVNPAGTATKWRFAYGTSKRHLKKKTAKQSAGSGATPVGVLAVIKGLKPGHRYYVELIAESANGRTHGKIVSFKTKGHKHRRHHGEHKGHGKHKGHHHKHRH